MPRFRASSHGVPGILSKKPGTATGGTQAAEGRTSHGTGRIGSGDCWRNELMWNISLPASRTLLRTCVLALCALPMHCQTANTGAIAGTVSDPSRALVPRAAVVINNQGTGEK